MATEIDLPSTWQKYRPGMCEGCWAGCCTLPVEVTAEDLRFMGLCEEDEVRGSLKKLAKRLKQAGVVKQFRAATGLFILEQKSNRDCQYLDSSRRCQIYDRRPTVCRKFPTIGPRPGFCPRQNRD